MSRLFRVQYTSDLHLERYKTLPAFESLLKPVAPYLALAGNIGHPQQLRPLFDWATTRWDRIFYVVGNHEYYGSTYERRLNELFALTDRYENLHFLHPSSPYFCEAENVAVVGCTLWSEVNPASAWESVADYYAIEGATVGSLNTLHHAEKSVLDAEIRYWTDQGAQICVVTHHLPSFRLVHPRFAINSAKDCFASASDHLIRAPVRLWIYGHSHICSHHVLNNVLCVANAKGYQGEPTGWRNDVWMDIPYMDPQELEAVAKKDQTPLRSSTYLEDSELPLL